MHSIEASASPLVNERPLDGMRVVAIEQSVAGPLCSRILADLGATVVKVEPPGGDFSRRWDDHAAGESAQFWWLNRAKKSVELDFRDARDREVLRRLLSHADVCVYNMSPGAADRLGLGIEELADRYPRLVSCQISGYGARTSQRSRKAYDMLIQAEAGVMSITGDADHPARTGVSISDVSTGLYAALLVLAALHERSRTGRGRKLDVSMMDATAEFVGPMLLSYVNAGILYPRMLDQHHAIAPYGVYVTGDGRSVLLAIQQDAEWRRLCEHFLLAPELADAKRFATNLARVRSRDAVNAVVGRAFAARTYEQVQKDLDTLGLAFAHVNDMSRVADHPALRERGLLEEVQAASGARVTTLVGLAERAFGVSRDARRVRPPTVGEDRDEVLAALGAPLETSALSEEALERPTSLDVQD
jgi:itaconate CoA-transferase